MLLNTEELLALINGDAEPDRLADLLDRLEHCPESAAALQVLVSLRANREEALEALRLAAETDATPMPLRHRAARPGPPSPGWAWATQGLRLAASIALIAVVGVWAATTFLIPAEATDSRLLAITTFVNNVVLGPANTVTGDPEAPQLTSSKIVIVDEALSALEAHDYNAALGLLEGQPTDAEGKIPLFRGMAEYFLDNYEWALAEFEEVRELSTSTLTDSDSIIAHQAAWYEANTLLKLDRPMQALSALEDVRSQKNFAFYREAEKTYETLRATLGLSRSNRRD